MDTKFKSVLDAIVYTTSYDPQCNNSMLRTFLFAIQTETLAKIWHFDLPLGRTYDPVKAKMLTIDTRN